MLDPCEIQRFSSSSAGSGPIRAGHGQSGPDPGTGDPAAGEIVEARRRIGMLGAERRLADRQRALVERPRPRTTASDDDMAQVWDAARQEITSLPGHAGSVTSAAFPSGRVPPPSTTTRRGCEAAAFGSTKKNALDWPMARFRFVEVDFGGGPPISCKKFR